MSHPVLEPRDSVSSLKISPLKGDVSPYPEYADETEIVRQFSQMNNMDEVSSNDAILISDIRNSLVSRRKPIVNGVGSAFTPISKRVRSEEQTPSPYVRKSLRFDSSTESSPYMSRNTSSVMDEYIVPVDATHNLMVLDSCPQMNDEYEKEFITVKSIGEGNFTMVDLVISKSTNRPYAIKRSKDKILKTIERHRYLREVQMFAEVSACPNVVQYYKCWQEDSFMYILMDCCSRGSLTNFIATQKHIPEHFIWVLLRTILQTLVFLHSHNVVHLDIKPDNILFDELGHILLGDMGCATHINEISVFSDLRYMSLDGLEDQVIPQRDIFSLGLVAYQLMSKEELPVSGDRWVALREENGIPMIAGYSSVLNSLVRQMTSPSSASSAEQLLRQLPSGINSFEGEIRSVIRTSCPSVLETTKKSRKKRLKVSTDNSDNLDDRSNMTTPVDVVKSSYSAVFKF